MTELLAMRAYEVVPKRDAVCSFAVATGTGLVLSGMRLAQSESRSGRTELASPSLLGRRCVSSGFPMVVVG
jgi:hypothetical protein